MSDWLIIFTKKPANDICRFFCQARLLLLAYTQLTAAFAASVIEQNHIDA